MREGDEVVIRGVIVNANEGDAIAVDLFKTRLDAPRAGRRIIVGKYEAEVEIAHFKAGEVVNVEGHTLKFTVLAQHEGWVWLTNATPQTNPWTVRASACTLAPEGAE